MISASGGMSRAAARRERQRTARELKRTERERYKKRLEGHRETEREAKRRRRADLELARAMCRENAAAAKEAADAVYKRAHAALLAKRKATKADARTGCQGSKAQIRAQADRQIRESKRLRAEEKAFRAELERIERGNRQRTRPRSSSSERRSESADEVRQNIPAHLQPLWKRVGKSIKATERKSRTEAFMQYAEENPSEAIQAQESDADRQFRRELEEHERAERRARGGSRRRSSESAHVPF
jgi:hypothetical protein